MTRTLEKPKTDLARNAQHGGTLSLGHIDTNALSAMERVVTELQMIQSEQGRFMQAFAMAAAIRQMRDLITSDMMQDVMQLQGTSLGFRTDKDSNQGYDEQTVKDCVIEATLRGSRLVGNEFNIIARRCYQTKEFFQRALGELPGISNVRLTPGVPRMAGGEATIRMNVFWKQNGSDECIIDGEGKPGRVFSIRVNNGMGADAVIGKATRKALKAAYEQINGSISIPDGDVEGDESEPAAGSPHLKGAAGLVARLHGTTDRPLSAGTKLVDDAGQTIATGPAAETPEPDTSGVDAEPEPPPVQATQSTTTLTSWWAQVNELAEAVGIQPDQLDRGVGKWAVAERVKGKEHTAPFDKQKVLFDAIRNREGSFA